MAPALPPELHISIISQVEERNSLLNLCLTCKALQYEAEAALYAFVYGLRDSTREAEQRYHILFLTTINTNQRLARRVILYRIGSIVHYKLNPLWDLLQAGLKKMINLEHFMYREYSGRSSGELLLDVPCRLRTLEWGSHGDEEYMNKILVQQNSLEDLRYYECESGTSFPNNACPNLKVLNGNRSVVEAFLPGRSVEELVWVPDLFDSPNGPIRGLESALAGIKKFSFGGYFSRPSIAMLADYLSSIEVLQIYGWDPEHLKGEEEAIKRLETLRVFVISITWGVSYSLYLTPEMMDKLVQSCFSALPRLQLMYISSIDDAGMPKSYYRWDRELSTGRHVGKDEVDSLFRSLYH